MKPCLYLSAGFVGGAIGALLLAEMGASSVTWNWRPNHSHVVAYATISIAFAVQGLLIQALSNSRQQAGR
jgi:CDP-diglyceride synthetase